MTECLGLFAKYWQPGEVKTRLAATIGPERAAQVYRLFVETLLERLSDCPARKSLAFSPKQREDEFRHVAPTCWTLEPQSEGDLGSRMKAFFSCRFEAGYDRVVLLGSDCPHFPVESIAQAFEGLRTHQVVLGPSEDGGYWLVGAAGEVPEIFGGIPWSTPRVWQSTIDTLQAKNTSYFTLPVCYDIDQQADLERLIRELESSRGVDDSLDRLLQNLA